MRLSRALGVLAGVAVLILLATIAWLDGNSARATFPGANGRIAFITYRSGPSIEVYSMNADGSGQVNMTNNPASDFPASWSPDGTKLLFFTDRDGPDGALYVMNSDGSAPTLVTAASTYFGGGSWSPDGTKIAFTGMQDGRPQVFVMNADGSNQTNVSNNSDYDLAGDWSPDGTKLLFSSVHGSVPSQIYVMNVDGSNQTALTSSGSNIVPGWSPDGTKIVYQHGPQIWTMDADGSNQVNVSNDPVYATDPAWSPDGSKIAFSSLRDDPLNQTNNYEIYVMNADGSGQVNISNSPGYDASPVWQPGCSVPPETDTDGDALPDCWELAGDLDGNGTMDINLPAMGANPNVKDIFVEVDWMDCSVAASSGCSPSHTTDGLDSRAQEMLIATFWCAPERIVLHIDAGPSSIMDPTVDSCQTRRASGPTWGSLSAGTAVQHLDTYAVPSTIMTYMDSVRVPVFHHAFMQHKSFYYPTYVGYATQDFFTLGWGMYSFPRPISNTELPEAQAALFLHELGHQLGLAHDGGTGGFNYKPNHLSIMNYSDQGTGLIVNGTINRTFDYSRWALDPMDETALNESTGLGPDSLIAANGKYYGALFNCQSTSTFDFHVVLVAALNADWDCDGAESGALPGTCNDAIDNDGDNTLDQFDSDCFASIESSVTHDVNLDNAQTTLLGANDWANLIFGFWNIGPAGGSAASAAALPAFDTADGNDILPDSDGDGLIDAAEPTNGTSPSDPDSDNDGTEDGDEVGVYLTNPLTADSDGDGCKDGRELGTNPVAGGLRYPLNPNDYFDANHNGQVRINDIVLVVNAYYKDDNDGNPGLPPYAPAYDPGLDRTLPTGAPHPWSLQAGNGLQRVDDILNEVHQYFHDCA